MELMYVTNYSSFFFFFCNNNNLKINDSSTPKLKKAKAVNNVLMNPLLPKMHNGSKERMN